MSTQSIFWFRRDLRFIDNHGLFQALTQSKIVNPIFIFDKNITKKLDTNDHRLAFIKSQLNNLDEELIKFNSSLNIYYGSPIKIFEKINLKKISRIIKVPTIPCSESNSK